MFIDIFSEFKISCTQIVTYYLSESWKKNLIISFNEEIYDSIQKLVHYLPQMKALQKCKNCNN